MHINPIEYYDQANGEQIPVFKPTMSQFKDFKNFVQSIDHYGKVYGLVKVIPPTEWKEGLPNITPELERIRVRNPIEQHIIGNGGIYRQTNIEKRRPFTVKQWRTICDRVEHQLPKFQLDRSTMTNPIAKKRKRSTSLKSKKEINAEEIALAKSDSLDIIDFDPTSLKLDFNKETCHAIERNYWRNLTFTQPMYGADMEGSLFNDTVTSWNVSNLDNLLNSLGTELPGVNTPYLYFGMWKATFAWHVEDMDLYSINYLHFGAPKQWYVIKPEHRKKFELFMQNIFPQDFKNCKEFLRHKTFIVSPTLLANHGISVQRCVQHQGEFMITFPYAYHAGYNLGFNCAESVNFALDSWISIGKLAKSCHCMDDSVTINVADIEDELKKKKRAKSRL